MSKLPLGQLLLMKKMVSTPIDIRKDINWIAVAERYGCLPALWMWTETEQLVLMREMISSAAESE